MIYFNFGIRNPFNRTDLYHIWARHGELVKNKIWEIEFIKDKEALFDLVFRLNFNESHAGISLGVGVLFFVIMFTIYDRRHWDYETNSWET